MTLRDIVAALGLEVKAGGHLLAREVSGGYAGDMLSDVLAHARKGDLWVTLQTHVNVIAVASTKELAAVILVHKRTPEEMTLRKAEEEKIPILISPLSTYAVVGKLYELGIR